MNQENLLISFRMLNWFISCIVYEIYIFLFFSLTQEENCNLEDKSWSRI